MQLIAFDRVSHWKLFSKMIKKKVPMVIVRVIASWYQSQPMCIKWGKANSDYFNVSNGYAKVGYCDQSYLQYILMICQMN